MRGVHQLLGIIGITVLLLLGGTIGYVIIEGWSVLDGFYMTVITLATVGYSETHPISPAGRVFTLVLILTGVGFFLYVAGSSIQFLVEGGVRAAIGRRKLEKQIGRLKDHYIICGYGRIGRELCKYLRQKQKALVVIERDDNMIPTMESDEVLYLCGDSTDEMILIQAGIAHARGLVAALATDADNVFQVLTAKQLNPDLSIVARASQNATKKKLAAAGADKVISPYDLGARRMAHAILRPTVIHFLELAFADEATDINLEEIPVHAGSALENVTLMESGIRQNLNLIVVAIMRPDGQMVFNPAAATRLESDHTVIAVGQTESLARLAELLMPGGAPNEQ